MKDPAPTWVERFAHLLPSLVAEDSLFKGSGYEMTFSPVGAADILEKLYTVVTYESSTQLGSSSTWETVFLFQVHHKKRTKAEYEATPKFDAALQEQQSRRTGAALLRHLNDWFLDAEQSKCCQGFTIITLGQAGNFPQTQLEGEDSTYVHETRVTATIDTRAAYASAES